MLYLSALRESRLPRLPRYDFQLISCSASKNNLVLSRRKMLGLTGIAIVGAVPAVHTLRSILAGQIDFIWNEHRGVFRFDQQERWIIDAYHFGGKPKLKVQETIDFIKIELKDALYPGTDIKADFECEIRRKAFGWQMLIHLAFGDVMAQVPFKKWLIGEATIDSPISRLQHILLGGNQASLKIPEHTTLSFSPDWLLQLTGPSFFLLQYQGLELVSKGLALCLLGSQEPSIFRKRVDKRTLLTMERSGAKWDVKPVLPIWNEGVLDSRPDLFDRVQIETGESSHGSYRGAMLLESSSGHPKLFYSPGKRFMTDEDKPFTLPLTNVRYATTIDSSLKHSALMADYSHHQILRVRECSLKLGPSDNTPPFEAVVLNNRLERLRCEPSLLAVSAPLPDAIVETVRPPNGTRLAFNSALSPTHKPGTGVALEFNGQIEAKIPLSEKQVIRTQDLLVLNFKFTNLELRLLPGRGTRIVRSDVTRPSVITVELQPQSVAEERFREPLPRPLNVKSRVASRSRLSFELSEQDSSGFPYTLEELLRACRDGKLRVKGRPSGAASPPAPDETAIEAPYRLIVSPNDNGAWAHATLPVTQFREPATANSPSAPVLWTELWHTRLGVRLSNGQISEVDPTGRTLRAIWTRDLALTTGNPFDISLEPDDRKALVQLTYVDSVAPINVERLMLSSLGAWMKVQFASEPGHFLEAWRHHMMMGRDQYVKVAHRGYLYPWRHKATHITITERLFREVGGEVIAVLIRTDFLILRERTKIYDATTHAPFDGRSIFREVTFTDDQAIQIVPTEVCREDDPPDVCKPGVPTAKTEYFWPDVRTQAGTYQHYAFHAIGIDHNGTPIEFKPGAIFVRSDVVEENPDVPSIIRESYLGRDSFSSRNLDMRMQEVAFAPWSRNSNTVLETSKLSFSSMHIRPDELPPAQRRVPKFFPVIEQAEAQIPAVKQIRGQDFPITVAYNKTYLLRGFDDTGTCAPADTEPRNNKGKVFMDLVSPVEIDFFGDTDKAGSFFVPTLNVVALSAITGIVGGHATGDPADLKKSLDKFTCGVFDPKEFFQSLDLFGIDDIRKRIAEGDLTTIPELELPRIRYEKRVNGNGVEFDASFDWQPMVSFGSGSAKLTFTASRNRLLNLPGTPVSLLHCEMNNYILDTDDAKLSFRQLLYRNASNEALIVKTPLEAGQILFKRDLRYVQKFREHLGTGSARADAHVFEGTLTLNFGLRVPNIDFGIFSLKNIAVATTISIGYLGTRFGIDFRIAEPANPCALTVGPFYGKAHFLYRSSLLPLPICPPSIDAGFEFGASINFDVLGLASLSVSISAGIRFQLNLEFAIQLTGYLHCHGSMSVLGLITVGVGFDAALVLRNRNLCCNVNLHVDIDLFLFSVSVDVPLEFCFPGSDDITLLSPFPADNGLSAKSNFRDHPSARRGSLPQANPNPVRTPTFADQISEEDWEDYCEAFA